MGAASGWAGAGWGTVLPVQISLNHILGKAHHVLKAVVFDMDETLLDINLNAFIAIYFKDMTKILADIGRRPTLNTAAGLGSILVDLNANRRRGTDNRTNREFFDTAMEERCGVRTADPVVRDAIDFYEHEILPGKNNGLVCAKPMEGAHEALEMLQARGLRIALLTNPSFSEGVIRCRMGWGGLDQVPFELVTHMDNSTRCKPDPTYYLEQLEVLGLEPHEVLMVGNDPRRDFPTPSCGIQTAYVGQGKPGRAAWCGRMADFAPNFDAIEEAFLRRQVADALS